MFNPRKLPAVLLLSAIAASAAAATPAWVPQHSGTIERLRAVSAVSDKIAWASGNHGAVLKTVDGGVNWVILPVPEAAELDFRDIEAFSADKAYIMSIGSGSQSRIYKTIDGGITWKKQFVNADPAAFYDAIAFWDDRHGLAMSDPVNGRFRVIRTADGGNHWTPIDPSGMPPALPNEFSFAASGTCLVVGEKDSAWIATGAGETARVLYSRNAGLTWRVAATPVVAGSGSTGVFSLAFYNSKIGVAVGGDYSQVAQQNSNLARTRNGGKRWSTIGSTLLPAFRSGVAFVPGSHAHGLIAVGPQGSDLSIDGGKSWTSLGGEGLHALDIAGSDRPLAVWAVGEGGQIVKLSGLPRIR